MSTDANINGGGEQTPLVKLTRKDFVSDQEVRWCPGCGDYAILAQVQKVMPELGIKRENTVFVSGIGCSSRFPYYMNTYGFHTIHGRAPAIATGIKASNPELSVWVITGDGDALSIGGNHLIHAIRRNLDINIILFNNRIYGLTKGQYSPTSEFGKKTKSTPFGVIDYPLNPLSIALAAEATFVARSFDTNTTHLQMVVERAMHHKGVSFVEVYQNCNIFNDHAFDMFTARDVKEDRMIELEHGKPLVFGKEKDRGISIRDMHLEVVDLKNGASESDLIVHDEKAPDSYLAFMLGRMEYPEYPVPIGVFRDVEKDTYEDMMQEQIDEAVARMGPGNLDKLIRGGDTWVIE
ncbi:MAG TPA: 2-oxoacid:ferredoxin oxidoreductase subunit beta [Blastocatellia bacterium]|jgi:2-oxoglutarate ferredoxin oxidoreductase subunit beta|nr:2-oxoacid:ferredoxin oxidoreductase subunit beta [Blastocatellia bacterium]